MTADDVRGVALEDLQSMDPDAAFVALGRSHKDFAEAVLRLERFGTTFKPLVGVPTISNTAAIGDLHLSTRSENCLSRQGVRTVGQLRLSSASRLMGLTNFGARSLHDVVVALSRRGLTLSTGVESSNMPEDLVLGRPALEWIRMTPVEALDELDGSFPDFAQTVLDLEQLGVAFRTAGRLAPAPDAGSITELGLDARAHNCLVERAITTVGQLRTLTAADLMGFAAFGAQSLFDVIAKLASHGLTLGSLQTFPNGSDARPRQTRTAESLIEQLVTIAGVHGQLDPSMTVLDAMGLIDPELLSRPSSELLIENSEYYTLAARIGRIRDGLKDTAALAFDTRAVISGLPPLNDVASVSGLTREGIRQAELSVARRLAGDPLILEVAQRLVQLAPCASLRTFHAAGLTLDASLGAPLLVARSQLGLEARAEIARHSTFVGDVVTIASPANADEIVKGAIDDLRRILNRDEFRCGSIESLIEEIQAEIPLFSVVDLGSEDLDAGVMEFLSNAPIWLDGDGHFVTAVSRSAFLEGYLLLVGEASLDEITEVFDSVFAPDVDAAAFDRRVIGKLQLLDDLVETSPKVWAHRAWGAERVPGVAELMREMILASGDAGMGINDVIEKVTSVIPTARESTIRTYAAAGLMFRLRDGRVTLGDGTLTAEPERSSSMHRDDEGRWVWTGRRDDRQLYHSSMNVPPALFAAAGMRLGENMVVDFPTGEARCGYATNNVFFVSRGGVRSVLDAAAVMDGDAFRFIVTGERSMICERV